MHTLDWKNLSFAYLPTKGNIRCYCRNGKWSKPEITTSEEVTLHIAATCLHYGQDVFEGLKAYRGADGRVRLFRARENAKRLTESGQYLQMDVPGEEMFMDMVRQVVKYNEEFVPPHDSGATLYIRPLLIGTSAQVGVKRADDYLFLIFVTPVGPYFKEGFKPVSVIIDRDHDRAAPQGTGHTKCGGNYAASLISLDICHHMGYATMLYLDAAEKKYIDECGPANFFAIRGNSYITPDSHSILPSITNMSLMELAKDMGMTVEQRKVEVGELATFDEVGACGTAAVISPVGKIFDPATGQTFEYCKDGQAGKVSTKLYNHLRAIQYGDEADKFGWIDVI
ncbi:MAG: branched-chain amino acid aminotransferase [Prevotellaceae bacterium]|jgi:branched-chain amino acid aminotransferase|nr:branched-chain amino acid aminotransferase [Prevotellaceae bacterium]